MELFYALHKTRVSDLNNETYFALINEPALISNVPFLFNKQTLYNTD